MPERIYKSGLLTKMVFVALAMILFLGLDSFGREGVRLYSIGNNSPWNSSATWSLTLNGPASGIVPQSNDTVNIVSTVVQNIHFSFSGNGILLVTGTGILRGDNMDMDFSGNSVLKCSGEIKSNNLHFSENASLVIDATGKILVKSSLVNNSTFKHDISGKLSVTGSLFVGASASFSGNGAVESVHFDGTGNVFNITPLSIVPDGSLMTENNWIGSLNNSWTEPLNWAAKVLPAENSNISILSSTHNPVISDEVNCDKLYINSGSSITVSPAAELAVNATLSVIGTGKLILKNTISEKSSLIINGDVTGKIQAEYPVVAGQKNFVSSPVEMALTGTFINMYLRPYNEVSSQWGEYIVPTTDAMQVMQGYELYSLFTETRTFIGTPDNSPKSFPISNSGNGLNLTGNPFPCYIDWENNDEDASQRNAIAAAIYYPDPSGSGNFSVYLPGGDDAVSLNNGSRYIAPMQGFFVKAGKQGSFTLTEKSRVRNYTDSRVAEKNNAIKFKLRDSDGLTDEVMFRVLSNSTFDFDDELDALKIQGNTNSPSMHLKSNDDVKYAINTIPVLNSSTEIPLSVECTKAGMFSISSVGSFNFEYRYPVILEDKELGVFVDLRVDSVYSFHHTPDMNTGRFVLHFNSTEGIEELGDGLTIVNQYQGEVKVSGNENSIYTANLFTTEGKLISSSKGILSEGISLSTGNQPGGVCVLQLLSGKKTIVKKILTN